MCLFDYYFYWLSNKKPYICDIFLDIWKIIMTTVFESRLWTTVMEHSRATKVNELTASELRWVFTYENMKPNSDVRKQLDGLIPFSKSCLADHFRFFDFSLWVSFNPAFSRADLAEYVDWEVKKLRALLDYIESLNLPMLEDSIRADLARIGIDASAHPRSRYPTNFGMTIKEISKYLSALDSLVIDDNSSSSEVHGSIKILKEMLNSLHHIEDIIRYRIKLDRLLSKTPRSQIN